MNELSIASLISILRKNLAYILTAMLVFAIVAYAFCSFVAVPTYQAKAYFIGGNGGVGTDLEERETIQNSDVNASLALIKTYVYLLQTDGVYADLAKELKTNKELKTKTTYSASMLKSMTEVAPRDEDSLIIDVKVTCENKDDAVKIVKAFTAVGSEYIMKCMPKGYITGEHSDRAPQNYPNTATTVVFAAILAFVLVYGICLVASMMDKTIKGEQNFIDNYDIPVLGNIPNFKVAAREERK